MFAQLMAFLFAPPDPSARADLKRHAAEIGQDPKQVSQGHEQMMLMAFGFNFSLPSPDGPYTEKRTLATREEEHWQHIQKDQARREAGGSARKAPKPDRVRPKNWTTTYIEDPDGYDDLDITARERVMPRGETEARQAKMPGSPLHHGLGLKMATSAALEPESAAIGAGAEARDGISRGTVVEVSSGLCRVALPDRTLLCNLRSALRTPHSGFSNVLAAGDEVVVSHTRVSHNGHERGMVEAVLPRRSALARPDVFYSHLQQVIVANVDQVLIVAAWREPAFWPELVDRYLIAAARYNLAPIICINKSRSRRRGSCRAGAHPGRLPTDRLSHPRHQRADRRRAGRAARGAGRTHHGAGGPVGCRQILTAERRRAGTSPADRRGERPSA